MRLEIVDGLARIRFTRPERANTISRRFVDEFSEFIFEVESLEEARVIVISADGRVFSGGGDLREFAAIGESMTEHVGSLVSSLHSSLLRLNRLPKPVIACVNGAASGAGLSIVAAADIAVAGASSKFSMAYTKVGLTPDGGATYFLIRHVGLRRALELVLTNRTLSAEEALEWGLLTRVVADDRVEHETESIAMAMVDGPGFALGEAKRLTYRGFDLALADALDQEVRTIEKALSSTDAVEGMAAFLESRAPFWTVQAPQNKHGMDKQDQKE